MELGGMKYYLIVGEGWGDLDGCNLMKGVEEKDWKGEFGFLGGDLMGGGGG